MSAWDMLYEAILSVAASPWPKDLIGKVKRILGIESTALRAPEFQFKIDSESAEKNFRFSL